KSFSELDWETKISGINCLYNAVHDGKLMITDFGISKLLENNSKSIS
ncbi:36872_t:CDS:1, partial [Racocetra persica]